MIKIFLPYFFLFTGMLCADVNLASPDPGFEQGKKFWYFMKPVQYGSFVREGTGGSQALMIRNDSELPARQGGLYRKDFIPVSAGKTYIFEVDFRGKLTEGFASGRVNVFKKDKEKKNTLIKTFETLRVSGEPGRWNRLHCTFTVPPDGELIHFELSARNFRGTIFFDNVSLTEGDGAFRIPLLEAPPDTGKRDADFADRALRLTGFLAYPLHNDALADEQTEVLLAQTRYAIYGTILLHHDPMRKLKASCTRRDGPLWNDDSVEIFITQTNAFRPYYHFILNTTNAVYDALENNAVWNSNIKTVSQRLSDSCDCIHFVLPLKDIGYHSELDAHMNELRWRMNFTRSHHLPGKPVVYSTFAKVNSFHNPENFVVMEGLTGGRPSIVSCRYRNLGTADENAVKQQRVWPIHQPLYQELLSDKPNPLKGESAFIWPRPIEAKANTEFAIQYGQPYTLEMILEEYRKFRLHPYSTGNLAALSEWGRKTGIGAAVYAPYYLNNYSFIYDPAANRDFLNEVKSILTQYHTGIWAVSLGDEAFSQTLRRFIARANDPGELEKDAALRRAVEQIRTEYGFGKYSVPKSLNEENPFGWIAVRRWALDRMLETQKALYELCKEYRGVNGKPILVISHDHVDWAFMQNQSRFASWQDIVTAQILPSNDPNRQTIAFRAKLLRDLTAKNVWLCVHVEPYAGNYSSKETAASLSEAVRGGGTGLQLWNYDFVADQRKMGSSQFDYYGHRPRWDTLMDCVRKMQQNNLLQFPKEDFAILVSNTTSFAHAKMRIPQYESAFNLMGPGAGAWFRFISDTQVLDHKIDLTDWKLLIIPKGNIISRELAPKLKEFLRQGGTILCFDPEFMSSHISGENTSFLREEIFGAKTVPATESQVCFLKQPPFSGTGKAMLPVTGILHTLLPADGTLILAKFSDGKAAMTLKNYPGGGKAILSAFELQLHQNANPLWRAFFKRTLEELGIETGRNIWNFSFPYQPEKEPEFKLKCLTGNHFYWWNNEVRATANVRLPQAYYTYNIAPDGEKGSLRYSFADGRLTNRLKAPQSGDLANFKGNKNLIRSGKLHRGLFADAWSNPAALEIMFHFGEKITVNKAVLFWHGELPDGTVCGTDGREVPFNGGQTDGVRECAISLPGLKTDVLTIRIPNRGRGQSLLLSEVEIWGEN